LEKVATTGSATFYNRISYDSESTPEKRRASGGIHWEVLEKRIARSSEAYQRPIIRKKIRDLVEYYGSCMDQGVLPAIPGAVILVSDRPLEFRAAGKNPFLGLLQVPAEEGALRALDGQHRLLALHEVAQRVKLSQFTVGAIIFAGLQADQVVEMFVTINSKHTRLNPSHLISLQGRRLYPDKSLALCHDIIRVLNTQEGSALQGEIKLLGVGRGRVSQAALAAALKGVLASLEADLGPRASDRFMEGARRFFVNYFKQIARAFPTAWSGRKYSVKTAAALRAFVEVVPDVLAVLKGKRVDFADSDEIFGVISPWNTVLGDARFETEGQWRAKLGGGTRGTVDILERELRAAIGTNAPAP
jgi:DGQHR domain-containing protein